MVARMDGATNQVQVEMNEKIMEVMSHFNYGGILVKKEDRMRASQIVGEGLKALVQSVDIQCQERTSGRRGVD